MRSGACAAGWLRRKPLPLADTAGSTLENAAGNCRCPVAAGRQTDSTAFILRVTSVVSASTSA